MRARPAPLCLHLPPAGWVLSAPDLNRRGIYPRFIDPTGYHLNMTAWQRALTAREPVGDCVHCDGQLIPVPTHQAGQITWYGAECNGVDGNDNAYKHEIASPEGRVLARSSRQSEMPAGWWERRANYLNKLKGGSE